MTTYCAVGDLLTGNIPLATYTDPTKYVQDAADEIDSKIGFVYETPIDIVDPTPVPRPARLLLKRLNTFLATGRLLMAADAGGENDRLHAYGYSLVQEATVALDQIASGQIIIEGAVPINTGDDTQVTTIIVNNLDSESNVEAFYNRVANPAYLYGYGTFGESLVR